MSLLPLSVEDAVNEFKTDIILKALVVDDSDIDRLILNNLLKNYNVDVCEINDVLMAVEMFVQYKPDIVFMDVNMSGENGYEVTKKIKQLSYNDFVPVIFVTSATDDIALEKCVGLGGDGFIIKPIKENLLRAKIGSLLRTKIIYDELRYQKENILRDSEIQKKDLADADRVIVNIHETHFDDTGNIKWFHAPQNILSGDIICSAISPSGNHVILLGDNTGHGLPAAIGSMITCEIFYSMVKKGIETQLIIGEVNKKLLQLLPVDRFLAACFIEIDEEYRVMKIWNAGIPSIIKYNIGGSLIQKIPSMNLPLGILPINNNEFPPFRVNVDVGDYVYVYSDGLTEEINDTGEMFGEQRLIETIQSSNGFDCRVDRIKNSLINFMGNTKQSDDILLLEINCGKPPNKNYKNYKNYYKEQIPMDWHVRFEFNSDLLRNQDPVPLIIQSIVEMQGFGSHRENIFLILTEMYSNALEHGILKLESSIKDKTDGFSQYYDLRQSRLNELTDCNVEVDIKHKAVDTKGMLTITISDSGDGFDHAKIIDNLSQNTNTYGRGLPFLRDLCQKCEFSNEGKQLEVEYVWECTLDNNKIVNIFKAP